MSKREKYNRIKIELQVTLHSKQYFKIFNVAKVDKLEVYEKPSEELQKGITSFDSHTFNLFTGFSR